MREAVKLVTPLASRKSSEPIAYNGLRIAKGSITSGYSKGISQYRSNGVADDVDITIPNAQLKNLLASLGRMNGEVDVIDAGARIYLRTSTMEVFWAKGGHFPVLDRAFDMKPRASIFVDTLAFQRALRLMNALFDSVQIKYEGAGPGATLTISGASERDAGCAKVRGWMHSLKSKDVQTERSFTVSAKDLCDVAMAVQSAQTRVAALELGVVIETCDRDSECRTLILGSERR